MDVESGCVESAAFLFYILTRFIQKSDLPILAERFTTSKLSTFSDLSRLTTYGFRGEALASISHVAHLSVTTKTRTTTCAYNTLFWMGSLFQLSLVRLRNLKPCAGNDGTSITVRALSKTSSSTPPTRLAALRNTSEEYSRILDVMNKYAIHNPSVAFTCKKAGSASPDLSTPSGSSTKHAIKIIYGLKEDTRLVESQRIKRALENVYTGILPKGASPFIYLSLKIDPRSVDVNVHPTKKEVHFLNEEEITTRICDVVQEKIAEKSHSRVFEYQKVYSHNKVRTSLQDRTLDSMFPVVNPSQIGDSSADPNLSQSFSRYREVKESECFLTSVIGLRKRLEKGKHKLLTEILEKHIFVGIVDMDLCLSLVQYSTKLYLINHGALAEELFYQLGLRQFGDFSRLKLEPSPSLHDLIGIAVDEEEISEETTLSKSEIVDRIVKLLCEGPRRSMLAEYFSLKISEDGLVQSLPLLLRDYTPNLDKLPLFLMRLGTQVNWASETECFETFLRELAYFYVPGPMLDAQASVDLEQEKEEDETAGARAERWQIQHILFPAMRRYLAAPKSLLDVDVVQVASLPDLYKVFERC
ncbi:hypothetical protein BT96DRAFT_960757 [Gymnopus androsaceus JB14]|uniref:DNA mismatch repair protein S5 domain-containing protein n=1 Tax=Gymnopus androsaceus JB14 TaxID=1447944 RepID=A0A6A4GJB2_9AGAR|nr:hypothetical protein BT96DRAFT_960757 [Gymnopus androsaceus JB14]